MPVHDGLGHGRPQPHEPVFQQIVRGSHLDRLHREILADRSRNQNKGDVMAAFPEQLQRTQPVECSEIVIRKNQIEPRVDARRKRLLRVHARHFKNESLAP